MEASGSHSVVTHTKRYYGVSEPRGNAPPILKGHFDFLTNDYNFWTSIVRLFGNPENDDKFPGALLHAQQNQLVIAEYLWVNHGMNEYARKYFEAKSTVFKGKPLTYQILNTQALQDPGNLSEKYAEFPELLLTSVTLEFKRLQAENELKQARAAWRHGGPSVSPDLEVKAMLAQVPVSPRNLDQSSMEVGATLTTSGPNTSVITDYYWARSPTLLSTRGRKTFPFEIEDLNRQLRSSQPDCLRL